MSDYITPDQLRDWIGSTQTTNASAVQLGCSLASRVIDWLCGQYFYQDSAVNDRYYCPDDSWTACIRGAGISTTTGLVVVTDDGYNNFTSGTSTWTLNTDFVLKPRNPDVTGTTQPWTELAATGTRYFPPPQLGHRETVKVTAKFGWTAVPEAVKDSALLFGAWYFMQKDAPDGSIGIDGWGPRFIRENPAVKMTLAPYMRDPIAVA